MKLQATKFNNVVEAAYDLPLEEREELKTLLELNIADARRDEMLQNFKSTKKELKAGKLKFKSSITDLKKSV